MSEEKPSATMAEDARRFIEREIEAFFARLERPQPQRRDIREPNCPDDPEDWSPL